MSFPVIAAFDLLKKGLEVIFPDPVKRAEAEAKLQEARDAGELQQIDADLDDERERTKRHSSDMKSDNKLSKNIRPAALVYLLIVVSLLAVTDGNLQWTHADDTVWQFTVKDDYILLFKALLVMAFGFYFTSRGLEKIADIIRGTRK